MEKTKEELLKYAVKMRQMGDTYRAMLEYLQRNTDDEAVIKEIINTVDKLEKENKFKTPERSTGSLSIISLILGIVLTVAGIILILSLWKKGIIAGLPVILIVIGLYALSGKIG